MPNKRVTMQDIADACGLSRNTVSKVFNGRGAVPPETQALVMKKAEELGYGSPVGTAPALSGSPGKSIALLTSRMPKDTHFGTALLSSFTNQISRSGYSLKIYEISAEELKRKALPTLFSVEQTAGIIGIELFDRDYLNMICALGIPFVVFDGPVGSDSFLMHCDYITMESTGSVMNVVRTLIALGARKIGFVGDIDHCDSFYERWRGYRKALKEARLPRDDRLCILAPDSSPYDSTDWLLEQINQMPELPDAFVCANDYLAIHLMGALKRKGLSVPDQVMITGFDGTVQSSFTDPALTTVEIPGREMGNMAAFVLMNRIAYPGLPFFSARIRTTPVWRGSTRSLDP